MSSAKRELQSGLPPIGYGSMMAIKCFLHNVFEIDVKQDWDRRRP